MPGRYQYCVDRWVGENLVLIGGAIAKSESGGSMLCRTTRTGTHPNQVDCFGLLHCGKQDLAGKQPCSQYTNLYRLFRSARFGTNIDPATLFRTFRVSDQDSHEGLFPFPGYELIGLGCIVDFKPMGNKSLETNLAVGQQLKKGFHVARFGPPHVRDRIVTSTLFVLGVVPSRTIGARDAEVELFFVVALSRNSGSH